MFGLKDRLPDPGGNRKQGGATKSQHRQGRAIDLYPPRGMSLDEFPAKARMFARMEPLVGALGMYRWGVHLDTRARAGGQLVGWSRVTAGTAMHDRRS